MSTLYRIITAAYETAPAAIPHERVLRTIGDCYSTKQLLQMLAQDHPERLATLLETQAHAESQAEFDTTLECGTAQAPARVPSPLSFDDIKLSIVAGDHPKPADNLYLRTSLRALAQFLNDRPKRAMLLHADCDRVIRSAVSMLGGSLRRRNQAAHGEGPTSIEQHPDFIRCSDAIALAATNEVLSGVFEILSQRRARQFKPSSVVTWCASRDAMSQTPDDLFERAQSWFNASPAGQQLADHCRAYQEKLRLVLSSEHVSSHAAIVAAAMLLAHSPRAQAAMLAATLPGSTVKSTTVFQQWVRDQSTSKPEHYALATQVRDLLREVSLQA